MHKWIARQTADMKKKKAIEEKDLVRQYRKLQKVPSLRHEAVICNLWPMLTWKAGKKNDVIVLLESD